MDKQTTSREAQVIEVAMDVPCFRRNRICGGAACDLSHSKTSSRYAKERSTSMRKLLIPFLLCIIFMAVEVVGGIRANSLAILTDAAHLLSDASAFAISLFSLWASGWEATPSQSYGFFRVEILGALLSVQLIWLLAGVLVYEAIARMMHDHGEVEGSLMLAVSAFVLVVNAAAAVLLGHDHGRGGHGHSITTQPRHHPEDEEMKQLILLSPPSKETKQKKKQKQKQKRNINVHSAYLHALGDSIQSIGVMVGGAIIWYKPQWKIIDLVCTLIFSTIFLLTTIKMLMTILDILMESTPREIDATRLEKGLCEMDGVVGIHELHIWAITVGKVLLACHVTITPEAEADCVLDGVVGYIRREHNISHVTVQIERQESIAS